jgi:hypothetical protein
MKIYCFTSWSGMGSGVPLSALSLPNGGVVSLCPRGHPQAWALHISSEKQEKHTPCRRKGI